MTTNRFERFLAGSMTVRRFCHEVGMDDVANDLVPVFWQLQDAHDRVVHREARKLVLGIIRAFRSGRLQSGKISKTR